MASTITASTLKVTIREDIKLNGVQQGGSHTFELNSVNEIYKRIVTCPTNQNTTVAHFKSTVHAASGSLDMEDVKYIRVTNLDDSNSAKLNLQIDAGENDTQADESATLLLEAGKSFMMGSPNDGVNVDDTDSAIPDTLVDLESIVISTKDTTGATGEVDIEVFIASI